MARRWRMVAAVAAVFVAVVAVAVGLAVARGGSGSVQPGSSGPSAVVGPDVVTLTSPPRIVRLPILTGPKYVPSLRFTPIPGKCVGANIPVGGSPLPCPGVPGH